MRGSESEAGEDPTALMPEGATGSLAEMKRPETVAAAPQAPGAGIPFVKSVGYYKDSRGKKPLTGPVPDASCVML